MYIPKHIIRVHAQGKRSVTACSFGILSSRSCLNGSSFSMTDDRVELGPSDGCTPQLYSLVLSPHWVHLHLELHAIQVVEAKSFIYCLHHN
jgi:hypothetical protein